MIDLVKLGNAISSMRREKGYTQDELGSRLGVSAQAISKWERGISLPDTDMLPDISRILDVSIDYLLGITDFNSNSASFSENSSKESFTPVNPMDFMIADELTIIVSANLFAESDGSFLDEINSVLKRIPEFRIEMAKKRGLLIPIVRVIDSNEIPDNTYQLLVRNKVKASGQIFNNKFMYICNDENANINGIPAKEPVYGKKAVWIDADSKEAIIKEGGTCFSISDIITTHFREIALSNAAALMHKQAVKAIIENIKTRYPVIVEDLIPHKINYNSLHKIIVSLVSKGYVIRDMLTILEVISDCIETTDDIKIITAEIEKVLACN